MNGFYAGSSEDRQGHSRRSSRLVVYIYKGTGTDLETYKFASKWITKRLGTHEGITRTLHDCVVPYV